MEICTVLTDIKEEILSDAELEETLQSLPNHKAKRLKIKVETEFEGFPQSLPGSGYRYTCNMCQKNFQQKSSLKKHFEQHETEQGKLELSLLSMTNCTGCSFRGKDIFKLAQDEREIIQFMRRHQVLPTEHFCPRCHRLCVVNEKRHCFKCNKKKPKSKKICAYSRSIFAGTFLAGRNLTLEKIVLASWYWLSMSPPRQKFLQTDLQMSSESVVDWCSYFRKVVLNWSLKIKKIGGPGSVVQINVAQIGKGRYNTGLWLFGGIERGNPSNTFLATVEKVETIPTIIQEYLLPGTAVVTDCWEIYNSLKKLTDNGCQHLSVNHSENFVDPSPSNVERWWRNIRCSLARFTRKNENDAYLAEFLFKKAYPRENERFHAFWLEAADIFKDNHKQ